VSIVVRSGDLFTEEQVEVSDWLMRLESFGISRKKFDAERDKLSRQFGQPASVNDTVWRFLNILLVDHSGDPGKQKEILRLQSTLLSNEGKDPTRVLVEAEKARNRQDPEFRATPPSKQVFLGHDELAYVRRLRADGKLDKAEALLLKASPTPAVLDELRKIASKRARDAKKLANWSEVVAHLEGYLNYAEQWRAYCIEIVKQEPPSLTETESKLLDQAREKLAKS